MGDTEYYVFEETFAFSDIARDFSVAVTVENEEARLVSKTYCISPLRDAELTLADISSDSALRCVVIELLRACKSLCSDDVEAVLLFYGTHDTIKDREQRKNKKGEIRCLY